MDIADIPLVLKIENDSQVMPWSKESFTESLSKQNYCRVLENTEERNKILAFHIVSPIIDELHILTLAVCSEMYGRGLGHTLMHDIFEFAELQKLKKIFLEVRASNMIAQSLYKKWQFKQIAIRKDYYRTPHKSREDALVYMRLLN